MRRYLTGLLVPLALLIIGAKPAGAEERPASTVEQANQSVTAHMRRARAARDARRWAEAESAFRAALVAADPTLVPPAQRAEIIGEIGLCELTSRRYRDAAEHLAEALVERAALTPGLRDRFEEGRREAEEHVVRVYVAVKPPDGQLFVDGKPVTPNAATHVIFVDPGSHVFRARFVGLGDSVQTLEAAAGQKRDVFLTLERSEVQSPAPHSGWQPTDAGEGVGPALRTAGIALGVTTALVGVTSLIWAADVDGELRDTRKQIGLGSHGCWGPDAPDECKALHADFERRKALTRIGLVSLTATGVIAIATGVSFALADPAPASRQGARIDVLLGQENGLVLHGVW